jgi:hypothetical protein
MTQHRKKSGENHGQGFAVRPASSEPDGDPAFRRIKQQGQDARERAHDARDICSAYVAAASPSDVAPAEKLGHEYSKRNGTENISG